MRLLMTLAAGLSLGMPAVAGGPSSAAAAGVAAGDVMPPWVVSPTTAGIRPVVEALRSGDVTYVSGNHMARSDYVPLRPPL